MASKLPDETPRSESEGENRALRINRKRARRVSFADTEITSVHFFHRDDDGDCETSPKLNPRSSSDAAPQPDNELVGFYRDLAGDSDDSGEDEEGSADGRKSFFRPLGSPSPGGSSTAGSGASNDEYDFSGPVSSSFIRPGRLSDSGMSDDIHEETLDTTAFSMHYRSLARSETEEAKTPTAGRLVFEEKTATKDSNPSGSGSLMAITEPKKLSSPCLVPHAKGEDSDDMCIVDENPNRFNYESFSPTLDAILAESSNDLKALSSDVFMSFNSPMGSGVLKSDQNRGSQADHCDGRDSMLGFTRENSAEEAEASHIKPSEDARNVLSNGLTPGASDSEMQIPNPLISENGRSTEDASLEASRKTLQFDDDSQNQSPHQQSNDNPVGVNSPRTGQRDFASASDQQAVLITPKSKRGPYLVSPFPKDTDLQSDLPVKHVESISTYKTLDHSYTGSSIKQGTDKLMKHVESDEPMKHAESISRVKTPDRSYVVSPLSKETDLQSDMPMKHVENISKFKTPDHSYAGSVIKQGTDKLMKHAESDEPMKHAESISRVKTPDRSYLVSPFSKETDLQSDVPMINVESISKLKTLDHPYAGSSIKHGTEKLMKHVESDKPMKHTESISRAKTPNRSYLVSPLSKETGLQSDMPVKHFESISKFKTPDRSYAGSSIKQGTDKLMKHVESDKSMKHTESISRLKSGDRSNAGSSVKQATDKLMSRLSKYSSRDSPVGSALIQNSNGLQSTCLASMNKHLFSADRESEENRNLDCLDVTQLNQAETPRNTNNSSKATVSSFRLTSSGLIVRQQSVTSENPEKRLFTSVTDSVFADNQDIDPVLHVESGELRTLPSPGEKMTLNYRLPEKNLQPTLMLTSDSPQSRESTHSLLRRAEAQNSQRETPSQKDAWGDVMDVLSVMNPTEQSPSKEPTLGSPKKALYENSHEKESTQTFSRKELLQSQPAKKLTWSPLGSKTTLSSARKERTESPFSARHNNDLLSSRSKYESSPRSIAEGDDGVNVYQNDSTKSPLFTKDVESARKRGSTAVALEDENCTRKSPRIIGTSDVVNIGKNDSKLLSFQNKVCNGNDRNDADRNDKHWLCILDKFSQDPEQFLSPSVKLLNLRAIGTLEDILSCSLKPRNYEMLDSEVTQRAAENSSWRHKKRIAETSLLLKKIAHEKAKLQLMNAKREKLLKKGEFYKSGIQECQILKSKVQQSKICERGVHVGEYDLQSRSVNHDSECPVPSSSADAMKHEIKVLDGDINSLSNTLQSYSNLKGEPSYADTLASIQDHLMRRKYCRLIRQNLQLWRIDGFACRNGGYNVLLNYKDYLTQRLTLFSRNESNTISNQLNETKIQKVFPNMGALIPFAFVLNPKFTKRGIDVRCLGQETQVTSSLLCNLLDVVEEVQMAQIEISNLVESTFYSPSGQQLNLRLCFFEFNTGAKVNLTLDVTCLRRGTYPSEILPYEIWVPLARTQKSESLLDEVTRASQNLETGYLRIMRICRCVSQLLQASAT